MAVSVENNGPVTTVIIDRPEIRNAVGRADADALAQAFRAFDRDESASVAVLTGAAGTFCSGADLKAIAGGGTVTRIAADGDGPMGPSRMRLSKPVIAAIAGYAVAGGLELALWCDLRIAEKSAVLGVFNRRYGIPLVDGGTVRLPRLIGMSRALDLILTGRAVGAEEAASFGLVNRVVADGTVRIEAEALAAELSALPQVCLRSDRAAAYEQGGLPLDAALAAEFRHGVGTLDYGWVEGAKAFVAGGDKADAND